MFCGLFWCRIRKNLHFEGIYIFTLHQHTATSNITIRQQSFYITSKKKALKYRIYQGSDNRCEGYRDSGLNRLASVIIRQYTTVTN